MGKRRFRAPQVRRFAVTVVVTACVSALVARLFGEQVVSGLTNLPATPTGYQVLGWAVGGPPLLLAAMAWNDRRRFGPDQRKVRAVVYGVWFGLGGFLVPALTTNSYELYGDDVSTGNQLAFGWLCAGVANAAAIGFAAGIGVLRRRAAPDGQPPESEMAERFVELAWAVLLAIGFVFAAYGRQLGFVY